MGLSLKVIILVFAFANLSHQDGKDPLKDFCRRFGHSTAVIDRRLFIDGGLLNWNPISQNPVNYTNPYLLYDDLNATNQGMPQLYANLSKNSTTPSVAGGILWADEVNKVLYQFGGEHQNKGQPSDSFSIYDALLDQWNQTDLPDELNHVSYGAGVSVNDRAEGYYFGGWVGHRAKSITTGSLIHYDMIQNQFSNYTGPDDAGRAEGVLLYIPASDNGMLVYFGGIMDPSRNGTATASPMDKIFVYDILSARWYTQTAGGDIPAPRGQFCAGATWADDHSSYNIYTYGGIASNSTAFDDVYILSLPSFTWIKWWPTQPGPDRPHYGMTCNVISRSQMLVIGGIFPGDQDCDAPNQYGTHNLNLGANGPANSKWDLFFPNITTYQVPPDIIAKIGGGPSGGATVTKPITNWDNSDLSVYFSRVPKFAARSPTRSIPTATGSNYNGASGLTGGKRIGTIVGATLGGLVLLAILLGIMLYVLHRMKKKRRSGTPYRPAELASTIRSELYDESKIQIRTASDPHSIVNTHFHSQDFGQPTSPLASLSTTSPHSHNVKAELYGSPVTKHAQSAPNHEGSYSSSTPGSPPAGVFPLGPYYLEQAVQGQPPSPRNRQTSPQHPSERMGTSPGKVKALEPVSSSSYTETEEPYSASTTPVHFYPQPLNVRNKSREELHGHSDQAAPSPTIMRSTRSKFFETRR